MEYMELKASKREETGKGTAHRLRREGMLPAVLYGGGTDPMPLTIERKSVEKVLKSHSGGHSILNMKIDGVEDQFAMVKEVQSMTMKHMPIHIDLVRVSMDKKIEVEVPIMLINLENIKKSGGIIQQNLNELTVECLPGNIPDSIKVDMTDIAMGDSISVAALAAIEGVTILDEADEVIASVLAPKAAEETPVAAAAEGEAPTTAEVDKKGEKKEEKAKDEKPAKPTKK
jgi:large subunit ribosomal protein L25